MTNLLTDRKFLLRSDSYKWSQAYQYPKGTKRVYSYIEARGPKGAFVTFFGLQGWLKQVPKVITKEMVLYAQKRVLAHGEPFYFELWQKRIGNPLPIQIRAIPEGMTVPVGTPIVAVLDTNPEEDTWWVTGWLETQIVRAVWYPSTVCTRSRTMKKIIYSYLQETSDNPDAAINFKLHDFGARGVSSGESAEIGGAAHLVNFLGTDTFEALSWLEERYDEFMAGFSIPASEHSTMTSWGRDKETNAYENMLDLFAKPGALVAVVSDSYDIFNAAGNIWGITLKEKVINSKATVIIRPDSGDPVTVIIHLLKLLSERFGFTMNSKNYKVLNHVRIIQGDGIDETSIPAILEAVKQAGFSTDNLAMGMGGGLLQQLNRDTLSFAMKASAIEMEDGTILEFSKDPITQSAKKSKKGIHKVFKDFTLGTYDNMDQVDPDDLMQIVWQDGEFKKEWTFAEVRLMAAI